MKTIVSNKYLLFILLIAISTIATFGLLKTPWNKTEILPKRLGVVVDSGPIDSETSTHVTNFVYAAKIGSPAVVHIKTKVAVMTPGYQVPKPFRDFFDDEFCNRFFGTPGEDKESYQFAEASGSGVIIEESGYIVTNNHVITLAEEIEIVLHDQRTYVGEVIGSDPLTDLALLKIDEKNLPYILIGDSDQTEVGEWVLAVGNPFYNLSSTVTAGIISAKARNINILRDQEEIES